AICVRRRATEGEACPLDERAPGVEGFVLGLVLEMHARHRARRAVWGLRARVHLDVATSARCIGRHGAVLRAGSAGILRRVVVGMIVAVPGGDKSADLDAGVSAWDVVETAAVKIANLHLLRRQGLDRK